MTKNNDEISRDIFQKRIIRGLEGPGSDIFVDNEIESDRNNEIISDYPLQRYYSGILFPERELVNLDQQADIEIKNLTDSDDSDEEGFVEIISEESNIPDKEINQKKDDDDDDEIKITQNTFFPSNIGVTFCIDNQVKELDVKFSFGIYSQIEKDIKICIPESIFDEFIIHPSFPFKDLIRYEDGYMILKRKLKGKSSSPRSEEYAIYDSFKKQDGVKDSVIIHYFEKLIGRTWKREDIVENRTIFVDDIPKQELLYDKNIQKEKGNHLRVSYSVKKYSISKNPNSCYVKIQLINTSDRQPANQFSNSKEILNQKCIFQANIQIDAKSLKPYKSYLELNPLDEEAKILNYLYKDKFNYAIGHNCSAFWNITDNIVETTFFPTYDVKDTKNSFSKSDFIENPTNFDILNENLDIYNLSHFANISKDQLISNLREFVQLYGVWIQNQKQKPSTNKKIEENIFKKLDYNFERMKSNIDLLDEDLIFKAFQLANTAMLIQIIISNDKDLSGKEKDLNELNEDINHNSIDFFKNYDFNRLTFKRPKYRPFQLAFLLLNLDGIADLNSKARNDIVDLIWFPTGGGKTEAYLAVAAFSIIYRRIKYDSGYEGTSVIMRYTLRLLTAQQFERASRLIVALEFLRSYFPDDLKDEPITIGLWVGMSSTPNTIKEANDKVKEINEECNKENGYPENKNVFQISSCPWCGTKLIAKNNYGNWIYGFKIEGKNQNTKFKIKCLNSKCHFRNELPIQVVDEMLFDQPPTLLFGTVDKFAMLAWKANGNRFFNSLDESKLPPDLIIQDELHLLTGPLGSITGIYESVIEMLCSKNGRKPKIISSTATTRNTSNQIKALYGNKRDVNIFPPSGLSYDDSFFAKVSNIDSHRRYMGLIPTGKSSIDTQLQILANLFVARLEVYKTLIGNDEKDFDTFDKYWTIVSYYNSLKDVGKIHNKVGDEISNFTSTLQIRLFGDNSFYKFNYSYLYNRDVELTSRVSSKKIKHTLKLLEENTFNENTIKKSEFGSTYVTEVLDLVLATNMISVGIDIDRFNIMLINGQPRNIAEYIQASSRVGRKYKGLVIDLLDANRARDKSHFEHFIPFHQAFYKSVEPISITPFTENTLKKMLTSILITFIRHKIPGMSNNDAAQHFKPEMLEDLINEIKDRFSDCPKTFLQFQKSIEELSNDWLNKINKYDLKCYEKIDTPYKKEIGLLNKPSEKDFNDDDVWTVMQSMREIDTNSFIKIELPKHKRGENG